MTKKEELNLYLQKHKQITENIKSLIEDYKMFFNAVEDIFYNTKVELKEAIFLGREYNKFEFEDMQKFMGNEITQLKVQRLRWEILIDKLEKDSAKEITLDKREMLIRRIIEVCDSIPNTTDWNKIGCGAFMVEFSNGTCYINQNEIAFKDDVEKEFYKWSLMESEYILLRYHYKGITNPTNKKPNEN